MKEKVFDEGFVKLISYMGDDLAVVEAARISFGGSAYLDDRDKRILRYLIRNKHWTPFEQVQFKFHVKCPIFVARQWFRHRAFHYNELSRRYTSRNIEFWIPKELRIQDTKNKQGSLGVHEKSDEYVEKIRKLYEEIDELYHEMVEDGVAKELARCILPVSTFTEFVFTADLRNLINFIILRIDEHAQKEIRVFAEAILELIEECIPQTVEILKEEVLNEVLQNGQTKNGDKSEWNRIFEGQI